MASRGGARESASVEAVGGKITKNINLPYLDLIHYRDYLAGWMA